MARVVRRRERTLVVWALLFTPIPFMVTPVQGSVISVGYLQILGDNPAPGLQELTIFNNTGINNSSFTNTGSGCTSAYTACSDLNFTSWTLTVDYASTYYDVSGPVLPEPYVATSATFGDITPSSTNNVFDFDLCGGSAGNDSCPPETTITSVEFTGDITSSSFCLYDDAAGGCPTDQPITFIANPQFDLIWNGSSPQSPYVDEDNPYTTSPDITVTDQGAFGPVPEPGSFLLATSLVPLAWLRFRARSGPKCIIPAACD